MAASDIRKPEAQAAMAEARRVRQSGDVAALAQAVKKLNQLLNPKRGHNGSKNNRL